MLKQSGAPKLLARRMMANATPKWTLFCLSPFFVCDSSGILIRFVAFPTRLQHINTVMIWRVHYHLVIEAKSVNRCAVRLMLATMSRQLQSTMPRCNQIHRQNNDYSSCNASTLIYEIVNVRRWAWLASTHNSKQLSKVRLLHCFVRWKCQITARPAIKVINYKIDR